MKFRELQESIERLDELRFQTYDGKPLKVFKNLLWPRVKELVMSTNSKEARGYIVSNNEVLWWDSYEASHHDITVQLGMEYQDWRRIYVSLRDGPDVGSIFELTVATEVWDNPERFFKNPIIEALCDHNSELLIFYYDVSTARGEYMPIDQAIKRIFTDGK